MLLTNIIRATNRIKDVNEKLDAIYALFQVKPEFVDENSMSVAGVEVETIYHSRDLTISFARYKHKHCSLPMHAHQTSVEYLIAIRGKSLLMLPNNITRILHQGECAMLEPKLDHTTVSMTDDAEILAICVPPEVAYAKAPNGNH